MGAVAVGIALLLLAPWSISMLHPEGLVHTLFGPGLAVSRGLSLGEALRLETGRLGGAPFGWAIFVAAALPLVIGKGWRFSWAVRCWAVIVVDAVFVVAIGRGWLGLPVPSADLFLAPAAIALAWLIALGFVAFRIDLSEFRFGVPQAAAAVGVAWPSPSPPLPLFAAAGTGRFGLASSTLGIATRLHRLAAPKGDFRVLWVGDPETLPVDAGRIAPGLAYGTSRNGVGSLADRWAPPRAGSSACARRRHQDRAERPYHPPGPPARTDGASATSSCPAASGPRAAGRVVLSPSRDVAGALAEQVDFRQLDATNDLAVFENAAWVPIARQARRPRKPTTWSPPAGASRAAGDNEIAGVGRGPGRRKSDYSYCRHAAAGRVAVLFAETPSTNWHLRVGGRAAPSATPAYGFGSVYTTPRGGAATLGYSTPILRWLSLLLELAVWVVVGARRARMAPQHAGRGDVSSQRRALGRRALLAAVLIVVGVRRPRRSRRRSRRRASASPRPTRRRRRRPTRSPRRGTARRARRARRHTPTRRSSSSTRRRAGCAARSTSIGGDGNRGSRSVTVPPRARVATPLGEILQSRVRRRARAPRRRRRHRRARDDRPGRRRRRHVRIVGLDALVRARGRDDARRAARSTRCSTRSPTTPSSTSRFVTEQGRDAPAAFQGVVVPANGLVPLDVGTHVRRRAHVSAEINARRGRLVVEALQFHNGDGRRGVGLALGLPRTATTFVFPDGIAEPRSLRAAAPVQPEHAERRAVQLDLVLDAGDAQPFELRVSRRVGASPSISRRSRASRRPSATRCWSACSNDVPIAVARTTDVGPPNSRRGYLSDVGATSAAMHWGFAAGGTPPEVDEWIAILNEVRPRGDRVDHDDRRSSLLSLPGPRPGTGSPRRPPRVPHQRLRRQSRVAAGDQRAGPSSSTHHLRLAAPAPRRHGRRPRTTTAQPRLGVATACSAPKFADRKSVQHRG